MRKLFAIQSSGRPFSLLLVLLATCMVVPQGRAAEVLLFDPEQVCRLSLDNIPRSVSVRQGADVWLGYDLEKALVFKVWKAAADKPGIVVKSFKAASSGAPLFEGQAAEGWQLMRDGKSVSLTVRYLGCSQSKKSFEFRWELSHPDGIIKLSERIAMTPSPGSSQALRELRFDSLEQGVSVAIPAAYREAWLLKGEDGKPAKSFSNSAWHQLSLR